MITPQPLAVALRFALCLLSFCLIGTPPAFGQGAARSVSGVYSGTGTIEGTVVNAATGEMLGNALVLVDGTPRRAITDSNGAFRLTAVPAGKATLLVSYLGLEGRSVSVEVPANGVTGAHVELSRAGAGPKKAGGAEVVALQEVTVVADREMSAQALAMNEQRYAPNTPDYAKNLRRVLIAPTYTLGVKGTF